MAAKTLVSSLGEFLVPVGSPRGKKLLSPRCIGIELELENITRNPRKYLVAPYWEVTTDGSLRQIQDTSESLELRFAQPLGGANAEIALDMLASYLKKDKEILCTDRTGLHVHVDFRDFTLHQYRRFLYLYLLLEPFLYKFCEEGREHNIFCIPWYKTPSLIKSTLNAGELISSRLTSNNIRYSYKYSGLNVKALSEKGSVEFRMLEATTDVSKMYTWINILLSIVEYAHKNEFNIKKLLSDLEHSSSLIRSLTRESLNHLSSEEFNERMEMGKESVYLSLASSKFNAITESAFTKVKREDRGIGIKQNPPIDRLFPSTFEAPGLATADTRTSSNRPLFTRDSLNAMIGMHDDYPPAASSSTEGEE